LERLLRDVINDDRHWIRLLLRDSHDYTAIDLNRQSATAHTMGTTLDQCFFVTLRYIELLILWTDIFEVVLIVED
jgi:hypothetical protein